MAKPQMSELAGIVIPDLQEVNLSGLLEEEIDGAGSD